MPGEGCEGCEEGFEDDDNPGLWEYCCCCRCCWWRRLCSCCSCCSSWAELLFVAGWAWELLPTARLWHCTRLLTFVSTLISLNKLLVCTRLLSSASVGTSYTVSLLARSRSCWVSCAASCGSEWSGVDKWESGKAPNSPASTGKSKDAWSYVGSWTSFKATSRTKYLVTASSSCCFTMPNMTISSPRDFRRVSLFWLGMETCEWDIFSCTALAKSSRW